MSASSAMLCCSEAPIRGRMLLPCSSWAARWCSGCTMSAACIFTLCGLDPNLILRAPTLRRCRLQWYLLVHFGRNTLLNRTNGIFWRWPQVSRSRCAARFWSHQRDPSSLAPLRRCPGRCPPRTYLLIPLVRLWQIERSILIHRFRPRLVVFLP